MCKRVENRMSAILVTGDDSHAVDPSTPMVVISVRAFTDPNNGAPGLPAMAIKSGADRAPQMPPNGDELFQSILHCRAYREPAAGRRLSGCGASTYLAERA